jgi:hypothetical protein
VSRIRQPFLYGGGSADDTTINALITAASKQIQKLCRRYFVSQSYDDVYNGTGKRVLVLKNYPVISVQSVRFRPVSVFKMRNN